MYRGVRRYRIAGKVSEQILGDFWSHLLPARASEQGNVIGSVRIYIYIYIDVCTKKNCN